MKTNNNQNNILTIFFVAVICILSGGLFGAVTNMINGIISPYYYKAIMNWEFNNIWTAVIAQGIFEGLLYGVIFSLIFTISFGFVTRGQGTFMFAFKQIIKLICIVFICWSIGGIIALFLVTLSPEFYKVHFPKTPSDKSEMIRFAWVGGSIWGGMIGGLLSTIIGTIMIKNNWRESLP